MRSFITFDKEADLGYIYVLPPSRKIKIESTDELEVNEDIMLDVDVEDRIVGIDLFCARQFFQSMCRIPK